MPIKNWLDDELPSPRMLRVDLLGETADRILVHLELQARNDPDMALRMAEYALAIYRLHGRFPHQFCLYVGEAPMRMPNELHGPGFDTKYTLIDAHQLDGNELLESPEIGDNLIAILGRLRDHKSLGGHLKSGHRRSLQNRPTDHVQDMTFLPFPNPFGQVHPTQNSRRTYSSEE